MAKAKHIRVINTQEALTCEGGTRGPTPIERMYREISQLRHKLNNDSRELTHSERARDNARMIHLANQIAEMPAQDPADFLFKLMGHTVDGDHEVGDCGKPEKIWPEGRSLAMKPPASPLRSLYAQWVEVGRACEEAAQRGAESYASLRSQVIALEKQAADFFPNTVEDFAFKVLFASERAEQDGNRERITALLDMSRQIVESGSATPTHPTARGD